MVKPTCVLQVGMASSQRASSLPCSSLEINHQPPPSGSQTQQTESCNELVKPHIWSTYSIGRSMTSTQQDNLGRLHLWLLKADRWRQWIFGHLWLPQLRGLLAWAQWGKPGSGENLAQKIQSFFGPKLFKHINNTKGGCLTAQVVIGVFLF